MKNSTFSNCKKFGCKFKNPNIRKHIDNCKMRSKVPQITHIGIRFLESFSKERNKKPKLLLRTHYFCNEFEDYRGIWLVKHACDNTNPTAAYIFLIAQICMKKKKEVLNLLAMMEQNEPGKQIILAVRLDFRQMLKPMSY